MDSKKIVLIGLTIGSLIGGYMPMLWGAGALSISSLIGSTSGGIVGIYIAYQISQNL